MTNYETIFKKLIKLKIKVDENCEIAKNDNDKIQDCFLLLIRLQDVGFGI